jgi:hypothetical protein
LAKNNDDHCLPSPAPDWEREAQAGGHRVLAVWSSKKHTHQRPTIWRVVCFLEKTIKEQLDVLPVFH